MNCYQKRFGKLIALITLGSVLACGGGGGGGDGDRSLGGSPVTFQGTLFDTSNLALSGVVVCALGVCDDTDAAGLWGFQVSRESFSGGAVAFEFNAPALDTTTVVSDLRSDVRTVTIDFVVQPDGQITVAAVTQDGSTNDTDETPDNPDDDVCDIVRSAEVVIADALPSVSVSNGDVSCPSLRISDLLNVRASGSLTFEYELLPERPEVLAFDPPVGLVSSGERQAHTGVYLCNASESFTQTITARITHYNLDDGTQVTADEALEICGADAAVGNVTDSVQISFQVTP